MMRIWNMRTLIPPHSSIFETFIWMNKYQEIFLEFKLCTQTSNYNIRQNLNAKRRRKRGKRNKIVIHIYTSTLSNTLFLTISTRFIYIRNEKNTTKTLTLSTNLYTSFYTSLLEHTRKKKSISFVQSSFFHSFIFQKLYCFHKFKRKNKRKEKNTHLTHEHIYPIYNTRAYTLL